jgi:hypothetical protein
MGLDACIFGIGPFRKDLAPFLEYPADYYDGCPDGATVFASLFVCRTTGTSRELAAAFHVDPYAVWDNVEVRPEFVSVAFSNVVAALFENPGMNDDAVNDPDGGDFAALRALAAAPGWRLFYRPNG